MNNSFEKYLLNLIKPLLEKMQEKKVKTVYRKCRKNEHVNKIQNTFENMNRICASIPKFNNAFF
jgi:hypothetical protein